MFIRIVLAMMIALILPGLVLAEDGTLTVHITGLRNDKGAVRIALFNSVETYNTSNGDTGEAFKKTVTPIKSGEATETFKDLPYGEYAIKFFHDEDKSGKFTTGRFGLPKVEYGFSNNAYGLRSPPPFDKAKFDFSSMSLKMELKAKHAPI